MKIKVNGKYTSRVAHALCDALPDNWEYESYAYHPVDPDTYYHRIGNIWRKTLQEAIKELLNLIEIGIYDDNDINVPLLERATYSDGFEIYTIEKEN